MQFNEQLVRLSRSLLSGLLGLLSLRSFAPDLESPDETLNRYINAHITPRMRHATVSWAIEYSFYMAAVLAFLTFVIDYLGLLKQFGLAEIGTGHGYREGVLSLPELGASSLFGILAQGALLALALVALHLVLEKIWGAWPSQRALDELRLPSPLDERGFFPRLLGQAWAQQSPRKAPEAIAALMLNYCKQNALDDPDKLDDWIASLSKKPELEEDPEGGETSLRAQVVEFHEWLAKPESHTQAVHSFLDESVGVANRLKACREFPLVYLFCVVLKAVLP